MSEEISFEQLLKTPLEDFKAPQALPPGTYLCIVDGQPEFVEVGQKQTKAVNFMLKPISPGPDVDERQLKEILDGEPLQDKKIRHRLFMTKDSMHRLGKFLNNDLGIAFNGRSAEELIPESMGKQVYAKIAHTASQDGTQIYMNVTSTAKV